MAKRQVRIYEPVCEGLTEGLVGQTVTLCMKDNTIIFGIIAQLKDSSIIIKDKLLRKRAFPLKEVVEIILEKEDTI